MFGGHRHSIKPLLAIIASVACGKGSSPEPAEMDSTSSVRANEEAPDAMTPDMTAADTMAPSAPLPTFPANYCARAGAGPLERRAVALAIVMTYDSTRSNDCRTAGLTPRWNSDEAKPWWDYLFKYTTLMAGCPLIMGEIDGGILLFGPANTAAIGLQRPQLGRDDAQLLIDQYLDAFAAALSLADVERAAVEDYLWGTAASELGTGVSGVLSRCGVDGGM